MLCSCLFLPFITPSSVTPFIMLIIMLYSGSYIIVSSTYFLYSAQIFPFGFRILFVFSHCYHIICRIQYPYNRLAIISFAFFIFIISNADLFICCISKLSFKTTMPFGVLLIMVSEKDSGLFLQNGRHIFMVSPWPFSTATAFSRQVG